MFWRQLPLRGGDRRLHVLRGGVMFRLERELNGDVGAAQRIRRSHLVDACDGRELLFQRSRDADAIVSGLAPGSDAFTVIVGKVNVRKIADR